MSEPITGISYNSSGGELYDVSLLSQQTYIYTGSICLCFQLLQQFCCTSLILSSLPSVHYSQQATMDSSGDTILHEIKHGDLVPIINALPEQKAPIQALNQKVEEFFHCGPYAAFAAFQNLQAAITRSNYKLKDSRVEVPVTSDLGFLSRIFSSNLNATTIWRTPTMASTLVLLFACPNNVRTIHDVVTDQGRTFGGTPAIESTRTTSSMSLQESYQRAKSTAQGGQSTVMVVTLHDVLSLDVDEREDIGNYFPFSHFFTIGVGPEGVRVWQAGGHNGYGFDQYLRDGHARLRTWDEAEKFASNFDTLASQEVSI